MWWIRRFPATTSGAVLLCILVLWFAAMGALSPEELPHYAQSRREVIGMALMLILLPPYLVAVSIVTRRLSLRLVDELEPLSRRPQDCDRARRAIQNGWKRALLPGALLGVVLGLANTSSIDAFTTTVAAHVHIALMSGQMLLWLLIGLLLAIRFVASRGFRRLGEVLDFELFRLDQLKPLARSGLLDMVMIAGALALSPLQALDAEFRWYNYQYGLFVAVFASGLLVIWPLLPIHRRIRAEKARQLAHVERLLADEGSASTTAELSRLETLLAHRDRLKNLRPWLFSTDLVSRFLLYLISPPLAWVGAAIVERFVDRILTGGVAG